jgi:hypothetical protein
MFHFCVSLRQILGNQTESWGSASTNFEDFDCKAVLWVCILRFKRCYYCWGAVSYLRAHKEICCLRTREYFLKP